MLLHEALLSKLSQFGHKALDRHDSRDEASEDLDVAVLLQVSLGSNLSLLLVSQVLLEKHLVSLLGFGVQLQVKSREVVLVLGEDFGNLRVILVNQVHEDGVVVDSHVVVESLTLNDPLVVRRLMHVVARVWNRDPRLRYLYTVVDRVGGLLSLVLLVLLLSFLLLSLLVLLTVLSLSLASAVLTGVGAV